MHLLKETWTLAIETLSWMEMNNLGEREALARTVKQLGISNLDSARLAHRLVCETIRRQNLIDKLIDKTLKPHKLEGFDLGVQAFLRLYVYQTKMTRRQQTFDLKEAENIAQIARSILGWKTLKRIEPFIGLLLTQNADSVLEDVTDEQKIGLQTFHPTWFVRYCFKLFGRTETVSMLQANIDQLPTYIRLNTIKAEENEILERLARDDIKVEKVEQLKYVYILASTKLPLVKTTSYQEGLFYIQDKSSCLAAEAANPQTGMTVIDVCAAPGAKTSFLAQLMQNRGKIWSIDYSRRRMHMWKAEIFHMGVLIAEPLVADACLSLPLGLKADIVVLDPPCTNTGTFAKSPSDKWRITPRSVEKMANIQWRMLNSCAEIVKTGGALLYSTCSVTLEENEMLVERFLKWHSEFYMLEASPMIGSPGLRGMEKCQRLYPHVQRCNGFFIAKLLKGESG